MTPAFHPKSHPLIPGCWSSSLGSRTLHQWLSQSPGPAPPHRRSSQLPVLPHSGPKPSACASPILVLTTLSVGPQCGPDHAGTSLSVRWYELRRAGPASVFMASVPSTASPLTSGCPCDATRPLSLQRSSAPHTATTPSARAPAGAPAPPSLASQAAPAAALRAVSATTASCCPTVSASPSRTAAAPTLADTCR